jgi:predicted nucleotidyltransferase
MRREQATAKLVRLLEVVDAGQLPAPVQEVHVFGSYSRGALEPNDLDLVVVHDDPGEAYWQALRQEFADAGHDEMEQYVRSHRRFHSAMTRPLRKPGEKMDILLVRKLEEVCREGSKIKREDLVLLWSPADRDFRAKLDAISLDHSAGRFERNHILSLKRFHDHVERMEEVVAMVAEQQLMLTRLPIGDIIPNLNATNTHWLEHWRRCEVLGKKSLELLPYAMWWFEQHRQECSPPHQCVMWSRSYTHRADLGRPSLGRMLYVFQERAQVRRQCLIPHIKRGEPNELLVFERGACWASARREGA